jgi:Rad3-related DNA helicase/REP element-mobilizing transposase RayT
MEAGATVSGILGNGGAIARRLGSLYEFRPQQLEMAEGVQSALRGGHHLMVEAGTGVGKSFAYLLPAIDYAVKNKKRVVVSTHTISLQEQLIDKDIPLLRSVYPDEFTAVLVKGRSNYLCQRRLEQARGRQGMLFDRPEQLESLWAIEQWARETTDGSLADLPATPDPSVWERVAAEHGNCLGKKCQFYKECFWQAAKRRMTSGNILVVNHALFFSDLALRISGVNYLPKYDVVILDEAHTIEDVAANHFGLNISEYRLKYQLRTLYDPKRGKGLLSVHGACANDSIDSVIEIHQRMDGFFDHCIEWQHQHGRDNGRVHEPGIVENSLTPALRELSLRLKAMLPVLENQEEISELQAMSEKVSLLGEELDAIISQKMPDAVYWIDHSGRARRNVSLHAAPVNVAQGLRMHLFGNLPSVIMCSATMCTSAESSTGVPPVKKSKKVHGQDAHATGEDAPLKIRQGARLPHWTKVGSIYAVNFRLADSLPQEVLSAWSAERQAIIKNAESQNRPPSNEEMSRLKILFSDRVEKYLDSGIGACWLNDSRIAQLVQKALQHFDGQRYELFAWSIMPNHVHAVIKPLADFALEEILHSWKSFTAKKANEILKRDGDFWQPEYYDHVIRDDKELIHCCEYAWANPDSAGLEDWKWRGMKESRINAAMGMIEASEIQKEHGRDAHAMEEEHISADPAFSYMISRLGAEGTKTLSLGSPFDYAKQATLYIESDLPEPGDTARFAPAACEKIIEYLKQTRGGAFVLFTSYSALLDAASRLKSQLEDLGFPMLVQGQDAPRKILLERFRSTPNSVLMGTSSFWQGIDVRGDALRNVIIVKLPFSVPDEPVIEARLEAITRTGGNPFMEYSVPEAIIRLKQGFGRLIRSKTDTGIVVILDSRIKTKRYGKRFLQALPPCKIIVKERQRSGDA